MTMRLMNECGLVGYDRLMNYRRSSSVSRTANRARMMGRRCFITVFLSLFPFPFIHRTSGIGWGCIVG